MRTCLLFDLDGTLFDTREVNVAAYAEAFSASGVDFDEAAYRRNFGLRFEEMIAIIAPHVDSAKRTNIRHQKAAFYRQYVDRIRPNSGLISLVRNSAGRFRTGLVTTASRHNVDLILSHFDLSETDFDIIITGEDVVNGKPHPECYQRAIKELGFTAEQVIVFEDSDSGVAAAEAAGAKVIRVVM